MQAPNPLQRPPTVVDEPVMHVPLSAAPVLAPQGRQVPFVYRYCVGRQLVFRGVVAGATVVTGAVTVVCGGTCSLQRIRHSDWISIVFEKFLVPQQVAVLFLRNSALQIKKRPMSLGVSHENAAGMFKLVCYQQESAGTRQIAHCKNCHGLHVCPLARLSRQVCAQ